MGGCSVAHIATLARIQTKFNTKLGQVWQYCGDGDHKEYFIFQGFHHNEKLKSEAISEKQSLEIRKKFILTWIAP